MRLEPVSKRPPKHASGGARRATLHHIVLAVKKVCRIAGIEWHRCESRKRPKLRARPLPPVSYQVVYPESTRARGMQTDRCRIPRFEIEIPPRCARCFLAPGIAALLLAARRSIRGAMKLRLRRQFPPQPFCIGGGFRVAHIHRPLLRQTYLAKHRAINPQVALAPPEHRMLDAFLRLPGPRLFTPERSVLVTARLYEPQKIVICHVVVVDGELIHCNFMRAEFVVPPKSIGLQALQSQCCGPRRYLHQVRFRSQRFPRRPLRTANLPLARQPERPAWKAL